MRLPRPFALQPTVRGGQTNDYTAVMAFDRELARDLSDRKDRDTAPFFAGRRDEIQRFDSAINEMVKHDPRDRRAVFRIYQGAPGCGKTSLITHLQKTRSDDLLFVEIDESYLVSREALRDRVREVAAAEGRSATESPPQQ